VSDICAEAEPEPVDVGRDHVVACHLARAGGEAEN
jgi:hypothetical protein